MVVRDTQFVNHSVNKIYTDIVPLTEETHAHYTLPLPQKLVSTFCKHFVYAQSTGYNNVNISHCETLQEFIVIV